MPAPSLAELCADLADEHEALDGVVAPLTDDEWARPTPAEGWTVRDQIVHLASVDEIASRVAAAPGAFSQGLPELFGPDWSGDPLTRSGDLDPGGVLAWWRAARIELLAGFAELAPDARMPWFGPPMSAASFATARLMETWAHGQDVVDAVGGDRPPTDRLRHVAHLGVRTRRFSYAVRGREAPEAEPRVELVLPSGARWVAGPLDAVDRVVGPAVDFCRVVTQRRHLDDVGLEVSGPHAREWLLIAQAFAGEGTTTAGHRGR